MTVVIILLVILLGLVSWLWWEDRELWRAKAADSAAVLESERELRALDYHRRLLLENILRELNEGIIITDRDLRVMYANRRVSALLTGLQALEGKSLLEAIRNHEISDLARSSRETGQPRTLHLRLPQSQERILEVEAVPLPPVAGGGIRISLLDVTERVQTEQIRRDFVANASHELRTPLTLISGYTETLMDGVVDDPVAARRCLEVMDKHGKRILRIVEDMLTISRLEGASARLRMEPFEVRECVENVLEQLTPLVEQRKPEVDLQFPAEGCILHGDRFYWDQVFTNLLENALKENARPGLKLTVSARREDKMWSIRVSDNGVGIPAHDVPYVFKRFYRGAKHHSQNEVKGTGLGLSIVRRAIEAHGGSIELESSPGIETTFTIRVPAEPAASTTKE